MNKDKCYYCDTDNTLNPDGTRAQHLHPPSGEICWGYLIDASQYDCPMCNGKKDPHQDLCLSCKVDVDDYYENKK